MTVSPTASAASLAVPKLPVDSCLPVRLEAARCCQLAWLPQRVEKLLVLYGVDSLDWWCACVCGPRPAGAAAGGAAGRWQPPGHQPAAARAPARAPSQSTRGSAHLAQPTPRPADTPPEINSNLASEAVIGNATRQLHHPGSARAHWVHRHPREGRSARR